MGNQMDICFVILHYCAIEDTIECVESIKKNIDTQDYKIIIVDNDSPDKSGEKLHTIFDNEKIIIIRSDINLGFAKGNNLGFKYAKDNLDPKFIILLNNDTCIMQNDLFEKISNEYIISNFDILGPKIIIPNNQLNPYPIRKSLLTKNEISRIKCNLVLSIILNYIKLEKPIKYLHSYCRNRISKKQQLPIGTNYYSNEQIEMCQLHGCFYVFSINYINKYDGLDCRTFMYMEEDILFARVIKNHLKTIYSPYICIMHKEDRSTNSIFTKEDIKLRFKYLNILKSIKVLEMYL